MAESKVQFSGKASVTTGIAAGSVSNGAGLLGSEIDLSGSGNRDQLIELTLAASHSSAPSAGGPYYVYFLTAADGTNYEDGGTSVQPARIPDARINMRPVTGAQLVTIRDVRIGAPSKLKLLLWNATGQAATAVTLTANVYSDAVQASA